MEKELSLSKRLFKVRLCAAWHASVMVNPVSPNYCIPIPNSLVNAVTPYTIH